MSAPEAELKSHCMCNSDKAAKAHWRTVLDSFFLPLLLSNSHNQLSTWERELGEDIKDVRECRGGKGDAAFL